MPTQSTANLNLASVETLTTDEAGKWLDAIASGIDKSVRNHKLAIGRKLNDVIDSGLAVAAMFETDERDYSADFDGRKTALSKFYTKCGISQPDASKWAKFARNHEGITANEDASTTGITEGTIRDIKADVSPQRVGEFIAGLQGNPDIPRVTAEVVRREGRVAGLVAPAKNDSKPPVDTIQLAFNTLARELAADDVTLNKGQLKVSGPAIIARLLELGVEVSREVIAA